MKAYKNILLIKMSSLGDVLHALPTLKALRDNCPQARIVWAVHENFSAVLPGAPYIDEVIYIDKKRLKSISYWCELRRRLHAYHFDLCLDLQGLAKSAIVAFLSGATEKYGYWEMREGSFLVSKGLAGAHKQDHVIERYLDTVRVLGGTVNSVEFPLPSVQAEATVMTERFAAAGLTGPYIAVVPGARWAVKEWPVAYWSDFARRVTATGMNMVLLGSGDDCVKGREITAAAASPRLFDFTGKTSLRELMAAISMAQVYISADTGPLHIANALKKELIALFGPTCPDRTGPYGGVDAPYIHMLISPTAKATPENPLIDDPDCMAQLTVDTVWNTYEAVMKKVEP
jgi:heptosyltransferase-1/heptosyltransferase-2